METQPKKENNYELKPIGLGMVNLIEKIQEKFNQKYGFKPSIVDVTNMISDAIEKKGISIF